MAEPRKTAGMKGRVSALWVIAPSLVFAFLSRKPVPVLIVFAIGAVLRFGQSRPEIPAAYRPFLPLLQPVVVFVFLGGNPVVLAAVVFGVVTVIAQRSKLVHALEPWWKIQERISPFKRRVLSFVIPFVVGFGVGSIALGWEWTATLFSMVIGTAAAFLLLFVPPPAMRKSGKSR